jgi:hypothetical protein
MSKRGNPDYFKTDGHPAKDSDVDGDAKRRFGESRRVWLRAQERWMRPQRPIREVNAPPVREGDVPWRVSRPPLQTVPPLDAPPHTWLTSATRLAVRVVLAPAHALLSIADALVQRTLWRLERRL